MVWRWRERGLGGRRAWLLGVTGRRLEVGGPVLAIAQLAIPQHWPVHQVWGDGPWKGDNDFPSPGKGPHFHFALSLQIILQWAPTHSQNDWPPVGKIPFFHHKSMFRFHDPNMPRSLHFICGYLITWWLPYNPGGSDGKASARNATQESNLGREDPLEKEMATHSSTLA